LDFCQEDQQVDGYYTYPCEPDVWEGGKKDFITQLYEKEEKANDGAAVAIPERHILKVLWTVEVLRRKNVEYSKLPSPTLLKRPTDALPSIVSNIKIIGTFISGHWKEGCDRQEYDGSEEYRVVDFDITVADGSVMKLNAVVNEGSADANTGYWGGVFIRDSTKRVATIDGFGGDTETCIHEVANNLGAYVPFPESDLDFLTSYFENVERREQDFSEGDDIFYETYTPGICETQFEKIMGMVIDRFMTTTDKSDWLLPEFRKHLRVKRPPSMFLLYFQEMRSILLSENPNLTYGGVSKHISQRYKDLSAEELKKYEDLCHEGRKRYERELKECDVSRPSKHVERIWKVSGKSYGSS